MLSRFSMMLGGTTLALAGLIAGGAGSAAASPGTTPATIGPSGTPSPTPALTCPPALPVSGSASAVTDRSLTISYSLLLSPPCGYQPPITVTLFASLEDARQWQNPVAEAVSGPDRYGKVTIDGLAPDTAYWFRFSADGRRDPYVIGSARTAAAPACTATMTIDNAWGTGFVATVTVRNTGPDTIDSWSVAWRWPGGEHIQGLWGATAQDNGTAVTVRNASYNGTLPPTGSTTFGLLATTDAPPSEVALTCTR